MPRLVFNKSATTAYMNSPDVIKDEDFEEVIKKRGEAYEVYKGSDILGLYFDYDLKNPTDDTEEQFQKQLDEISKAISCFTTKKTDIGYEIPIQPIWKLCGYQNNKKFSRHGRCVNIAMSVADQRLFWKEIQRKMPNFDTAVYNSSGKMRCPLVSKDGDKSKILQPIDCQAHECLITGKLNNDYEMMRLPDELKPKSKTTQQIKKPSAEITTEERKNITNIIDMLSPTRSEVYDEWFKGGLAIYNTYGNTDYGFTLFKRFSLKSELHTATDFELKEHYEKYNHLNTNDNKITIGTLKYWAKNDNPEQYEELIIKEIKQICNYQPIDWCKYLKQNYNDNVFSTNKNWYIRQNGLVWEKKDNPFTYFIEIINKKIKNATYKCADLPNEKNRNDTLKILSKVKLDTPKFKSQLLTHAYNLFNDDNREKPLYRQLERLVFKNGVLDMRTGDFRDYEKDDNILNEHIIPYEYSPSTEQEQQLLLNTLGKIFCNNEEMLLFYQRTLGYSLSGIKDQEVLYGQIGHTSGNGKSKLMEYLSAILPCYVEKANKDVFEMNYSKRHKYINKWFGKRVIFAEELPKGKKLDADFIKSITGERNYNTDVMYGNSRDVEIIATLFMNSNYTPNFDACAGMARRYNEIPFKAKFYKQDDYDAITPIENCEFLANKRFVNDLIELKNAMYDFIVIGYQQYLNGGFNKPESVKNATADTINDNQDINGGLMDMFEFSDELRVSRFEIEEMLKLNDIKMKWKDVRDLLSSKRQVEWCRTLKRKVNGESKQGVFKGVGLKKKQINFEDDE